MSFLTPVTVVGLGPLLRPQFLWGVALLALPVIAHLLTRRVRHLQVFPSVRFFEASPSGSSRQDTLQKWLLLYLRLLGLLALVIAFTRPFWDLHPTFSAGEGPGLTLVVLDTSPSMGRTRHGGSLWSEARGIAEQTVQQAVSRGDLTNVLLAGAPPEWLMPEPTQQTAVLKQLLAAQELSASTARPVEAVQEALRILSEHPGARELVLISDFQKSNWPLPLVQDVPENVQITRIDFSNSATENISISRPRVMPASPQLGSPADISVQIRHHGVRSTHAEVRVFSGEDLLHVEQGTLQEGGTRRIQFTHTFTKEGWSTLRFELSGQDALAYDDTCRFSVNVGGKPLVVVASDEDRNNSDASAYYLERALSPQPGRASTARVVHLTAEAVAEGVPADARAVILAGSFASKPATVQTLLSFLKRGGSLIILAGHPFYRQLAADFTELAPPMLLPMDPVDWQVQSRQDPLWWQDMSLQSRMLRSFAPEVREALTGIPFTRRWDVKDSDVGGQILIRYRDGVPALLHQAHPGGGAVMVLNASLEPAAGGLADTGFFVALLHSLLEEALRTRQFPRRLVPGRGFSLTLPLSGDLAPEQNVVIGPDRLPVFDARFLHQQDLLSVRVPRPKIIGTYTVQVNGDPLAEVSVNPDETESPLQSHPVSDRDRLFPNQGETRVLDGMTPEVVSAYGVPAWGWLLLVLFIMLGLESTLLIRRRS